MEKKPTNPVHYLFPIAASTACLLSWLLMNNIFRTSISNYNSNYINKRSDVKGLNWVATAPTHVPLPH